MNLETLSVAGIIIAVVALLVVGVLIFAGITSWNSTGALVVRIAAIVLLVLSAVVLIYQLVDAKKKRKALSEAGFYSGLSAKPSMLDVSERENLAWHKSGWGEKSKPMNRSYNKVNRDFTAQDIDALQKTLTPEQKMALQRRVQSILAGTGAEPLNAEEMAMLKQYGTQGLQSGLNYLSKRAKKRAADRAAAEEAGKPFEEVDPNASIATRTRSAANKVADVFGNFITYAKENPEKVAEAQRFAEQFGQIAAQMSNDPNVAQTGQVAKTITQFLQPDAPATATTTTTTAAIESAPEPIAPQA